MKKEWINFLNTVNSVIEEFENDRNCDVIFFRGHCDETFELLPTLFRDMSIYHEEVETGLFYDFVSMAGEKMKNADSWEILFNMRHHGVPTRLLDWTTSFSTALYFAIYSKHHKNPHIWVLDAFDLSHKNKDLPIGLLNPYYDLKNNYVELFINGDQHKGIYRPEYPMPFYPPRNNSRIFAQQGVFTVHGTKTESLEVLAKDCLRKIEIPVNCIDEAQKFLKLAGVHQYSMFPDFDGLASILRERYRFS